MSSCHGCPAAGICPRDPAPKTVALVGPPNSGKTTLFNRLTGLRQKVANFPGVTVEQHTGLAQLPDGRTVGHHRPAGHLQPQGALGRRAGRARCPDRRARQDTARPEAILLVLDSTNLTRHLMLAAPILALGLPTLVILNMADDLRNRGGQIDLAALSEQLGAPVALVSARHGRRDRTGSRLSVRRHAHAQPRGIAGPAGSPQVPAMGRTRGQQGQLSRSRAAHLDAPPGRCVSASRRRSAGLSAGGGRVFSRPSSARPRR